MSSLTQGRSSVTPIEQLHSKAKTQFEQIKTRFSSLCVEELHTKAKTKMPPADIARLSELLHGQEERRLTEEEHADLNRLQEQMIEVAAARAAARWLLQNHAGAER